jgi:phage tail-like protein
MPNRSEPYSSFAYVIHVNRPLGSNMLLGGFSEVAGLANIQFGYRPPQELRRASELGGLTGAGQLLKFGGLYKVGDVTLKRGVVNSSTLWDWIAAARTSMASSKSDGTITLRNGTGQSVTQWNFTNAVPSRYSGPPLGGKGGNDIAIEELEITPERIWIAPPK